MEVVLVLRQDAIDLTGGDVDAQVEQLFEQQWLGDVAVVILVEDVALQDGSEVTAGQDIGGQRGQQGLALGGQDAFAQVAGDLGPDEQFLDEVFLVALGGGSGRRVGEGDRDLDGGDEGGVLGAFGGTGPLLARSPWRRGGRCFQAAGRDLGSRFFALEEGDLVAQFPDGLLQHLNPLLLGVDNAQQRLDQRSPFGVRNGRKLDLHAVQNSKATRKQLTSFHGFLRCYCDGSKSQRFQGVAA